MRNVERKLNALLETGVLIADGGMGTMLQSAGLEAGMMPEICNLDHPDWVEDIHRSYFDAGARLITTNTFGATRFKLQQYGLADRLEAVNHQAVEIARRAVGENVLVAGSIGPSGLLLAPMGTTTYTEMVAIFREQVDALRTAGADLAIIETMGDIGELRAAAQACFQGGLPFMASMTYDASQRSLSGSTPEVVAVVMEPFKPLAVGTNCGMGPAPMADIVKSYCAATHVPVFAEPNAGIPELIDGETVFRMQPEAFADAAIALAEQGAAMVGGCCGTTPDHIALLARALESMKPPGTRPRPGGVRFASRTRVFTFGNGLPFGIIGERINPTGRKKVSRQFKQGDISLALKDARRQYHAGAHLLDINAGVPGIDEAALMEKLVTEIQAAIPDVAVSVDSNDPETLKRGMNVSIGRPLVNSVSGDVQRLEKLLPLIRDCGANFIALAMDERGIPRDCAARMEIIRRILHHAEELGIDKHRILVDCLVFTVGSQPEQAVETLKAVREVTEMGYATVLGVSNVSFGLPGRSAIASSFLSMAISWGLSAGIINPLSAEMMTAVKASDLLMNRDVAARNYVAFLATLPKEPVKKARKVATEEKSVPAPSEGDQKVKPHAVVQAIVEGDKSGIVAVLDRALKVESPARILSDYLIPAIKSVGDAYGRGDLYLPQLILSGETMRQAVNHLKPLLSQSGGKGFHSTPFVLGTVHGDIHDIGKNILSVVLENHGFKVIDLGKNVPPDVFLEFIEKHAAPIVGLSALMTTTMPAMEKTVKKIKEQFPRVIVMVGGAVVTQAFADKIQADGYSKDAASAGVLACRLAGVAE